MPRPSRDELPTADGDKGVLTTSAWKGGRDATFCLLQLLARRPAGVAFARAEGSRLANSSHIPDRVDTRGQQHGIGFARPPGCGALRRSLHQRNARHPAQFLNGALQRHRVQRPRLLRGQSAQPGGNGAAERRQLGGRRRPGPVTSPTGKSRSTAERAFARQVAHAGEGGDFPRRSFAGAWPVFCCADADPGGDAGLWATTARILNSPAIRHKGCAFLPRPLEGDPPQRVCRGFRGQASQRQNLEASTCRIRDGPGRTGKWATARALAATQTGQSACWRW